MKFLKTEAGQLAFKSRSPQLSARQRSTFILFDGSKTNEQVLAATHGLGITQGDIDHLVEQGFIVAPAAALVRPVVAAERPAQPASGLTKQQRYVRWLIWRKEGGVSYTLRPPSKSDALRDRRTRSSRKK